MSKKGKNSTYIYVLTPIFHHQRGDQNHILKLNIENVEFIDKEFERIEKREADIVSLCDIDGVRSILHLEIQNGNDAKMHRRMLRYLVEITMEFPNLPVHQYVIYIGRETLTMKDTQKNVGLITPTRSSTCTRSIVTN